KEFARLGSGYKIAMRDLTIRGAGDLLGAEQSGFIDTVGIDMYIEMLEEAIALKKGEKREKEEMEVKTNVKETGYIPKSFAPDDFDKIGMYQKIDAIKDPESLQEYKESIIDQYGKLPKEVEQVFHKRDFDLSLKEAHVDGFKEYLDRAEITFTKDYSQSIDGVKLFEAFNNLSKDISLRYKDEKITAVAPESIYTMEMMMNIIHVAKEVKDAH
ncbi:MAG: transcription-repair coupling factor, partial [Solobacterium sp.]|nr:transcription-repair coupling factor [Solobacterium sp.]